MNEPALDLAIVMALMSSYKDRPVDPGMLIFGEVGLSGEVRAVSQAAQRVNEAAKLGFTLLRPAEGLPEPDEAGSGDEADRGCLRCGRRLGFCSKEKRMDGHQLMAQKPFRTAHTPKGKGNLVFLPGISPS